MLRRSDKKDGQLSEIVTNLGDPHELVIMYVIAPLPQVEKVIGNW
jgi:hypothetical protein